MAKRVIGQGYQMTVCGHTRRAPIEEMKSLGAVEVKTPKEVAERSDVTLTMVLTEAQTQEVIAEPNGLLQGAAKGSGIIMMSTLSPDCCRQMAQAAKAKGVLMLDAPVAGGRIGAEVGKLGISVGGPTEALEKYRPVLETMGTILHCGEEVGTGAIVKLANNMVAFTNLLVAHEAISWGIKNGASEELLVKMMRLGSGNSWMLQNWEGARNSFEPNSAAPQMALKDLSIALRVGGEVKKACPFAALACEFWKAGVPPIPKPDKKE
jgi:3-hydroxyisobutyrate dehydrogenase-like beta-hydroxyacid dehydrogenase